MTATSDTSPAIVKPATRLCSLPEVLTGTLALLASAVDDDVDEDEAEEAFVAAAPAAFEEVVDVFIALLATAAALFGLAEVAEGVTLLAAAEPEAAPAPMPPLDAFSTGASPAEGMALDVALGVDETATIGTREAPEAVVEEVEAVTEDTAAIEEEAAEAEAGQVRLNCGAESTEPTPTSPKLGLGNVGTASCNMYQNVLTLPNKNPQPTWSQYVCAF